MWYGDDSDLLASALKSANAQFERGVRNLLVLAPEVRMPIYRDRGQLARAFFGQPILTFPVDVTKGHAVGPTTTEFTPDGSFLNPKTPKGKLVKPDGTPAYTRVGAVLTIEEDLQPGSLPWIDHKILLAHNPYAEAPLPTDGWGSIPQLLEVAGEMAWNDGGPAF